MSSISSMLSGERVIPDSIQTPKNGNSFPEDSDTNNNNNNNNNNDNNSNIITDDAEESRLVQQRKRSKVSRACDECRRKKIRCDATFTTHSNTLEQPCTSCAKNNYICSFERVPLKRGPTKGYAKNESLTSLPSKNRSRNSSFGSSQVQPQITLPPLTSLTVGFHNQQQQRQQNISQPASPRKLSVNDEIPHVQVPNPQNPNTIIPQSQFWKVPHEAPFDRRSSVDSISSSISDSRFTFPQQSPQFMVRQSKYSESSIISDSEDDLRSASSPRNSIDIGNRPGSISQSNMLQGPASPALSISSTHSKNYYSLQKAPNQQQIQKTGPLAAPQIDTTHLIDSYYRFIHPNFPILPLNNQSLINILSKPLPTVEQSEFDELNRFIVQNFYKSLDLLISIVTKNRSPVNFSISPANGSNTSAQYLESLNIQFTGLSKIFNKVINQFDQFQQQTMVLFLSTLVILSYSVVLLGDQADVLIINSSVMLFNRIKIYKLFWNDSFEKRTINDNFDDYHFTLRRLWMNLNTLFSLHCVSHGLPRNTVMELKLNQIDKVFPIFPGVDKMKDVLKLGWMFSKIASLRNFNDNFISSGSKSNIAELFLNDYLRKDLKFTSTKELFGSVNTDNSLALQFFEFILAKFELIAFLEEVTRTHRGNAQNNPASGSFGKYDEDLLYDYQFKLSRIIKNQLTTQTQIFSNIDNYTNSIDANNLSSAVSPILPLIFKQSIKNLNILKMLVNSLQLNESILNRLSKLLNELIKLSNTLSLIKPFIDSDSNNHLRFKFNSSYLEFWDNFDSSSSNKSNISGKGASNIEDLKIQENWYGLMLDVLKFYKMEDYEGWF